jgi:hypothetical protein
MNSLGVLALQEKQIDVAEMWFLKAYEAGNKESAAELAKIYEMNGDELLAQEWKMKSTFEDDQNPD